MPSSVTNRKCLQPGGYLVWFFDRIISGTNFRYALRLSPEEQEQGRDYIAARIRNARLGLGKLIADERQRITKKAGY